MSNIKCSICNKNEQKFHTLTYGDWFSFDNKIYICLEGHFALEIFSQIKKEFSYHDKVIYISNVNIECEF